MRRKSAISGLLVAQFFGAFNDNAWKLIATFLAIRVVGGTLAGRPQSQAAAQAQTTLTFCALTLPLILFALPAGLLADRFRKSSIIRVLKGVEVALMGAAVWCLAFWSESWTAPVLILVLMGVQSALFSPSKFGILPELLGEQHLARGNASLQMWSFLAIILGTALGGVFLSWADDRLWLAGLPLLGGALIGFVASGSIPRTDPARHSVSPLPTLKTAGGMILGSRALYLPVLGVTVYWGIASLLGQNLLVYTRTVLGRSEAESGLPLAAFGAAVAVGSLLAGRLSRRRIEFGSLPLGICLLAAGSLAIGLAGPGFPVLLMLMCPMGIGSGLILVPLHSTLQMRAPAAYRGSVIALENIATSSTILLGSLAAGLLATIGTPASGIFLAAGLLLSVCLAVTLRLVSAEFLSLALRMLARIFYRFDVAGLEHVPVRGGALLTPNHVSYVDGLLLMAVVDRPVRFLAFSRYYHHPLLHPFMKALGILPVAADAGPRELIHSLRAAGDCLDRGELVCIFPEGQVTRTGMLQPFQRGVEVIAKDRQAPLIPVHLDLLWGSIFSFERRRFFFKIPRRIPYPVSITFGEALPATTSREELRHKVVELGSESAIRQAQSGSSLHAAFVRRARRHPLGRSFAEGEQKFQRAIQTLAGSLLLARLLRTAWREQQRVGILLPPCMPAVLANLAASLSGRTSVNLNYSLGNAGVESICRQAGLKSVLTSRLFLEKTGLALPFRVAPIWVEDLVSGATPGRRLVVFLAACLLPLSSLEKFAGSDGPVAGRDLATLVFSSGSSGDPKGVMLSHANLGSNADAVATVMRMTAKDSVLGILPFFHSFGYLALWVSALHGVSMPLYPTPLDAGAVERLVAGHRVTGLIATPTFLQLFLRRCSSHSFASLRWVVAGAEKLSPRLADAFEERFGIRPLEGYGCTECAPVVTASVPSHRRPGVCQTGSRRGSVGHPLPGVAVRIVDPESGRLLGPGQDGLILVRGPNLMQGYWEQPYATAEAFREGWYVTGDIGRLDESGFLSITDRLSRFSKIGGEMVPHGTLEQALEEALGTSPERKVAVTAIPDERKGESLVVLTLVARERILEALEQLRRSGFSNLFLPRQDRILQIEALPVLGSGKMDLRKLREIAAERMT